MLRVPCHAASCAKRWLSVSSFAMNSQKSYPPKRFNPINLDASLLKEKELTAEDLGPDKLDTNPTKMEQTLNKKIMQDYCKKHGLIKYGTKKELIARIRKYWKVDLFDHISSLELPLSNKEIFFLERSQGRIIESISALANVEMKFDKGTSKIVLAGMPASIRKANQLWESLMAIKSETLRNELDKSSEELVKISQTTGVYFDCIGGAEKVLDVKFLDYKSFAAAKTLLLRANDDKYLTDVLRLGLIGRATDRRRFSPVSFWDPSIRVPSDDYFRLVQSDNNVRLIESNTDADASMSSRKLENPDITDAENDATEERVKEHTEKLRKHFVETMEKNSLEYLSRSNMRTIARFGRLYLKNTTGLDQNQSSSSFEDPKSLYKWLQTTRPSVHILAGFGMRDFCRLGNPQWSRRTLVKYRLQNEPNSLFTVILQQTGPGRSSLTSAFLSSANPLFQGFFQFFNRQYDFSVETQQYDQLSLGESEEVAVFSEQFKQLNRFPHSLPLVMGERRYELDSIETQDHGEIPLNDGNTLEHTSGSLFSLQSTGHDRRFLGHTKDAILKNGSEQPLNLMEEWDQIVSSAFQLTKNKEEKETEEEEEEENH